MTHEYQPTTEQRDRMMLAIAKEKERDNPSHAHCTFIFAAMQHDADEGTHEGHWPVLESLWKEAQDA
tara:strand:- start:569 stop:769 length:201 start_codon:yes stop_codon:yes gene_type:complete